MGIETGIIAEEEDHTHTRARFLSVSEPKQGGKRDTTPHKLEQEKEGFIHLVLHTWMGNGKGELDWTQANGIGAIGWTGWSPNTPFLGRREGEKTSFLSIYIHIHFILVV